MVSKLRNEDENMSNVVSEMLDKCFYSKMTDFKRIYSKHEQVIGIDTVFKYNNKEYVCDEKAAIRYINKYLPTFSLELSFIDRSDSMHDGWLIDENKINNSFLFVWIDKAKKDVIDSIDDIEEIEIALVDKVKIIDFLASKGWTIEKLIRKAQLIRENENEYCGSIYKNEFKFVCSRQLVEKPVNVLISRDKLKILSDFSLKILKND